MLEMEEYQQMLFLDALVQEKQDKSLGHTIYQKKTHTKRYLNARLHHRPA